MEARDFTFEIVLTCFVLLLLIGTMVYYSYQYQSATGAAITLDMGLEELQQLFGKLPMLEYLGLTNLCVQLVLSPSITHSYAVSKTTELTISPAVRGCSEFAEDLIIRFPNYQKFRDFMKFPTCYKLVNNGRGQNFWFLPSRLWPVGDLPSCNAEFQEKFCPAVYYCIDPKNIPGNVLSCCEKEKLTPAQQQRALVASQAGLKKGVREQMVRI